METLVTISLDKPFTFDTTNLKQLDFLASALAPQLVPGIAFGLSGGLGSGKTTLVQLLCRYLGVTDVVNSPTFGYMHTYYAAGALVLHADLYQAKPVERILPELMDVLLAQSHITLIEWSDCWPDSPSFLSGLFVLSNKPDDHREIEYTPFHLTL